MELNEVNYKGRDVFQSVCTLIGEEGGGGGA